MTPITRPLMGPEARGFIESGAELPAPSPGGLPLGAASPRLAATRSVSSAATFARLPSIRALMAGSSTFESSKEKASHDVILLGHTHAVPEQGGLAEMVPEADCSLGNLWPIDHLGKVDIGALRRRGDERTSAAYAVGEVGSFPIGYRTSLRYPSTARWFRSMRTTGTDLAGVKRHLADNLHRAYLFGNDLGGIKQIYALKRLVFTVGHHLQAQLELGGGAGLDRVPQIPAMKIRIDASELLALFPDQAVLGGPGFQ